MNLTPVLRRFFTLLCPLALFAVEANGQSGLLQFKSQSFTAKEASLVAKVTVARIGGTQGTISANFSTSDGTAEAGQDYVGTNGTVTFGPGVTAVSLNLVLLNDLEHEMSETITLELTGESVALGNSYATVAITDNDPCAFSLTPSGQTHTAEGGTASISVDATAGCAWIPSEEADWIALLSGGQTGSGEIQYSFDAYVGYAPRTATIRVADQSYAVTQQGPFMPVAGNFNGVFHESELMQHESSGFLNVRLTGLGAFTAKMILGGKRLSFSGRFALDGRTTNEVALPDDRSATITMEVDLSGESDQIVGEVTGDNWASELIAHRAAFHRTEHPTTRAGRYTWRVAGDLEDVATEPGGDSIGTMTVDAGGMVKLTATLADGTKATQSCLLSEAGEWPLYVPLFGGRGAILSRVQFEDEDESDFTGNLAWFKPTGAGRIYLAGFAEGQALSGARYKPPTNATQRLLSFSSGAIAFSGGNLVVPFTNSMHFTNGNKVVNLSDNKLSLTIALPTGLFNGSVNPPGTSRSIPFKGVLHQKGINFGSGFFLGTSQSGQVYLAE